MGHIERGIGVEQQQEEEEEWGSHGRTTKPSGQHHTDQSVRTSRSQHKHKNNIHAHRGTYRIRIVLCSEGCTCSGGAFIFISCHKL